MKVRALMIAGLLAATIAVAGCGSSSSSSSSGATASGGDIPTFNPAEKVTVNSGAVHGRRTQAPEKGRVGLRRANPNVKVNVVGNINDDKIIAAAHSGNVPDAALSFTTDNTGVFCRDGAFLSLGKAIERDKIDVNNFPEAQRAYTEYKGNRCVLPAMADVYGLYYNKALLAKAGIAGPPKTMSELSEDAKKLTVRSGNSFKTVGYTPFAGFYENAAAHYAPSWGATWVQSNGKSARGHRRRVGRRGRMGQRASSATTATTRWCASRRGPGERVHLVQRIPDGEVRDEHRRGVAGQALIKAEAPGLEYGRAPACRRQQEANCTAVATRRETSPGSPRAPTTQAAAWELIKYLATNVKAQVELSEYLGNVPTWTPALEQAKAKASPQFQTFLKIFADPHTSTTPITPAGEDPSRRLRKYFEKFQAGEGGEIKKGLEGVASRIDAEEEQASGAGVRERSHRAADPRPRARRRGHWRRRRIVAVAAGPVGDRVLRVLRLPAAGERLLLVHPLRPAVLAAMAGAAQLRIPVQHGSGDLDGGSEHAVADVVMVPSQVLFALGVSMLCPRAWCAARASCARSSTCRRWPRSWPRRSASSTSSIPPRAR